MNKPKIIGITGGIGSGKSSVSKIVELLGFPVFYADTESKDILANHPKAVEEITKLLGQNAYTSMGKPNKVFIADKIFSDDQLRLKVNAILHPLVYEAFDAFIQRYQTAELIFHEAALIYQSGFDKKMDSVIFVASSEELRVNRVVQRDKISKEQVLARMAAQGNQEEFEKKSEFVITNDGTMQDLERKVKDVIETLTSN